MLYNRFLRASHSRNRTPLRVSDALLNIVETEPIERETSAFDEYDRENGYEDEEQEEQNTWKICGEIVDRVTKIAIRLMRESYGQCMKENIIELLKYLKFELETVNENTYHHYNMMHSFF